MYNHKRHSKVFKSWLILVEIVYFIIAIIAGFIIKTAQETFNWSLALLVWASNVPLLAILYAVYSILDNQENQIDISYKILEKLQNSQCHNKSVDKSILSNLASESLDSNNAWICPKCGDKNKQSSMQCSCGYIKAKAEPPAKKLNSMHTCSQCGKSFKFTYTMKKNQVKIPELSVVCPYCKSTETITSTNE